MTTTIQKWGNSQGIRIPKFLLDAMKWSEHEELVLSAEDDRIIISKASERKSIEELFEGFDGVYEPIQVDWGNPAGKELW